MPSGDITYSYSKITHQRISFNWRFKSNVKVKVTIQAVLSSLRPYVAFIAILIFETKVQTCLLSAKTQNLMCFSNTNF